MAKWIEPEFSKEKVKRAGKSILSAGGDSQEFSSAVPVFLNWRAAHAFPMQIMLDFLRKNALKVDKKAIAVQRLKRVASIFAKLVREKNMNLSRMEDIAGCRVVVQNVGHVRRIQKNLKESRTQNILHRERDYIAIPKPSGYRGVHLIYKYNCSKAVFKGMAVELQIRSKIQHSWATAVEVVGTYTRQALKASSGNTMWLDFFRYASVEFSKLEGCTPDPAFSDKDTFLKMKNLQEKLNVLERLATFKAATKVLTNDKEKGSGYFILILDIDTGVISYARFGKRQLSDATTFYDSQEQTYKADSTKDVVLVSAGSVRDLKKAYPNYFADTEVFERNLKKVHEENA